jgi:hypothetical protein
MEEMIIWKTKFNGIAVPVLGMNAQGELSSIVCKCAGLRGCLCLCTYEIHLLLEKAICEQGGAK